MSWQDRFFGETEYEKGHKAGARTAMIGGLLQRVLGSYDTWGEPNDDWQRGFVAGFKEKTGDDRAKPENTD